MSKKCPQCGLINWEHDEACKRCGAFLNQAAPAAHKWYIVYCVGMALVYLLTLGVGVMFLFIEPDRDMSEVETKIMGGVMIVLGLALAIPFAAAPFFPRQSWAWVFGLVLICLGLTSTCCLPVCIPLLLQWLKPEMKAYYGRQVQPIVPPPPPQFS